MVLYSVLFFISSILWLIWIRFYGGKLSGKGLFAVFAAGVISGPIAGSLTYFLRNLFQIQSGSSIAGNFFLFFLIVGPVEELAKFLAGFIASYQRRDFQSSADGILISVAVALGFAAGENVVYLNLYGVEATVLRLIFTNIAHVVFSVIWGYALGVVFHESAPMSFLISALAAGSILHGAYNFFLMLHPLSAFIILPALIPAIYFAVQFLQKENRRNR